MTAKGVVLLLLVVAASHFTAVTGLRCYACVQSGIEDDRRCERDPKSLPNSAINCNKKYCVIRRIEYVDQKGVVFSFYRGCEQRPDYLNTEIEDSQYKTYYRSCTTDLCNDGSGTTGGGGGGPISSGPDDDNSALLVPGIGSTASTASFSILAVAIVILMHTLIL